MSADVAEIRLPADETDTSPRQRTSRRARQHLAPWLLLLPALTLLLALFGYPLAEIVARSVTDPQPGLDNYTWFFTNDVNIKVLTRTFTTAAWVTAICLLLALPYAFLMTTVGPRMRAVLFLVVLVPFWTSLMVRTFAWIVLLQDSGVVNRLLAAVGLGPVPLIRTTTGVIIGMCQVLLPFMVLPLYAAMSKVDLRLIQAARSLGASARVAYTRVYLPLVAPGIFAGSLIVFIMSLGFYITPALLGSQSNTLLSSFIQQQISGLLQWGRGSAMGVVLLFCTFAVLGLVGLLTRGRSPLSGGFR